MSCVYPIDAWRSDRLNENGKRPLVFNPRNGFIDQPVQVPCGKCVGCAADRSRIWAIRLHHEASQHQQNAFVTLTYSDSTADCISKRDLQLFFKRLRRSIRVRYFACGEYGSKTRRPHYHAIIFGADFLGGAYQINEQLYGNKWLDKIWQDGKEGKARGFCSIAPVTFASCAYVAGYVNKKIGDPDTFNLMSRNPGIGHSWLDKYGKDIANTGACVIDGRELPVPKKYLEWGGDSLEHIKEENRKYYQSLSPAERWRRREKLRSREKNYQSKLKQKEETI